jgi:hypothetical protein
MQMHSRALAVVAAALLVPTLAWAHVTVRPRESAPGAEDQYTVRVPTEGAVATVKLELEIPDGVTVIDVPHPEGATHELKKANGRITAITGRRRLSRKRPRSSPSARAIPRPAKVSPGRRISTSPTARVPIGSAPPRSAPRPSPSSLRSSKPMTHRTISGVAAATMIFLATAAGAHDF